MEEKKLNIEKIWTIGKKIKLNSEMIWKIGKKSKLNSEIIWKIQKYRGKDTKNMEER
jgi:hypothetical protein